MQQLAARLRLTSPEEIEARHVASRSAIRPLLTALGTGMNSDYYPIVDQGAPQARFAGETASGLMRTSIAPVPVLEMLASQRVTGFDAPANPVAPSTRRTLFTSARDSITFLTTGTLGRESSVPLPRDIGILRAVVWDCAAVPPRVNLAEVMLDVAGVVNPMSPAERAASLWSSLRNAKCAAKLGADEMRWLDLYEAVGARDAGRMAAAGSALVAAPGISEAMRVYALTAAVTGQLAGGNHVEAQALLNETLGKLSAAARRDVPLRLLVALAHAELAPQAALMQR
jgi:hypothetical protein